MIWARPIPELQFERFIDTVLFHQMQAPAIAALAPDTPIVFPIAAIEQHGQHLPVWTDTLLTQALIDRVSLQMHDRVVFAPVMWMGNSHHHLDFNGTLSASPRVYLDLLCSLMDNAIEQGFRRIVFINGHGGNDVPAKQATFEIRQKYSHRDDLLFLMTTYWGLDVEPWTHDPSIVQREMGHACEWETSMVLALQPELVGPYASLETIEPGNPFRPGSRAWKTKDRTVPGHIGVPSAASAKKGELLLDLFSDALVHWLDRVVAWDGHSWEG
jgi:creatinine amidohydrolase